MKNSKIAVKLFFITTAVFIIFISATLIFQMFFFEKYYEQKKQKDFSSDLVELSQAISKGDLDQDSFTESFKKFDENNDSRSIIVDISQFNKGIIGGNLGADVGYMRYAFDEKINRSVLRLLVSEWGIFNQSEYMNSLYNDRKTYIYKKRFGNTSSIIGASPVMIGNSVDYVIFSMVSLQPVGDAVSTMKEFYIYIYFFAILIIFVMSSLYSMMISKPLIKLKKTAAKMTELDFSAKCDVKSQDELGELGTVLNFLSDKLDTTLSELKESNEKLKEDIEKERELEFMRKEFVAGVSHELKTPITLIGGYAEALKDNVAKEQDKDFFVDVIIDESKKMEYIIKDMLELSQLEAGSLKMNMETFCISELAEFVLRKFSRSISEKNVKVQISMENAPIMAFGDVLRIEQVLVNLMSNAMKNIIEHGVLKLSISSQPQTESTDCGFKAYKVCIENEGSHIPDQELDKIWERFYKIDKSRNRELEGTGIGLSIVKNILLQHNSSFGAENTETGVSFYFTLNNQQK